MIFQIAFLNDNGQPMLHFVGCFSCARDASRYARDVMSLASGNLTVAEISSGELADLVRVKSCPSATQANHWRSVADSSAQSFSPD
jgi:hypothetical protein